jgi:hypothetical protein
VSRELYAAREYILPFPIIRVSALPYSLNMAAILVVKLHEKCLLNIPCHIKICFTGTGIAQSVQRWVTGWTTRVRFPIVERDFSHPHSIQMCSGVYSALYPLGANGSFFGGKRQEREASHSPSSSAEVKNSGAIPLLPHTPSCHGA